MASGYYSPAAIRARAQARLGAPPPPAPPTPGLGTRALGGLGAAWDVASTALHYPKHIVDIAANYYANPTLRRRVLGGAEPIPTGEMAKEALLPAEDARESYLKSVVRPVVGLAADLATDPLIGGLKLLKPIAAAGQAARGIEAAARGGKAVAGMVPDAGMAARLARTARIGRGAEVATRGIEASFVPGMAQGAYEAGRETVRKLGEEGITPGAAEMALEAGTSGLFAAGTAWDRAQRRARMGERPERRAVPREAPAGLAPRARWQPGIRAGHPAGCPRH
jgi:hypothetical protein